ncbi:hypothetical protein Tco_0548096 [Tanacetum coccineum]
MVSSHPVFPPLTGYDIIGVEMRWDSLCNQDRIVGCPRIKGYIFGWYTNLILREYLHGDGERGFDCLTFALVLSKAHRERLLVVIGRRSHSGFEGEAFEPERMVSLGCSDNTTRIMRRTLMINLVFTLCEEQVIWNSVLMRLIYDLLALDSIVRFGFSDRRLERTTTFSISTISE